jgi:hypothetical protein
VGRFASTDPILAPYSSQGLNSYSYVWNNPATLIDPFGMQGNELSSPEGPIEDPFVVDTLNGYPGAAPDATITDTESGEVVSSSDTWSWAADPSTLAEGATPLPLPPSPAETHPTFSDNYGDWAPSEKTAEKMHQPDWFLSPRGQGGVGNARVWGDYDQVDTSDTMILTYTVLTLAVSVVEVGLGLAAARGAGVLLDDAVGFGVKNADEAAGGGQAAIRGICFAEGTPVHTSEGLKAIEEVEVGDLVWAWDEETGAVSLRRVVRLFETPDQPLVEVTIAHEGGTEETIRATLEHPFWTEDGWVAANELKPHDRVLLKSGEWSEVAGVSETGSQETVYNFEVETLHSYFVGEAGMLVHNVSALAAPKTGDLVHKSYNVGGATIDLLGEATVNGSQLILRDIAVYPAGTATAKIGPQAVRTIYPALAEEAKARGFSSLRITGTRLTGANIGKQIDTVIDLSKL